MNKRNSFVKYFYILVDDARLNTSRHDVIDIIEWIKFNISIIISHEPNVDIHLHSTFFLFSFGSLLSKIQKEEEEEEECK